MEPKENFLRAVKRNHPKWVPNGYENVITVYPPIVERPAKAGKDDFGVLWALKEDAEGGTYPAPNGNLMNTIDEWREKLILPNVDSYDWDSLKKQVESIDRSKFVIQGFVEMGLFERSYLLLGMEEALITYLTDPEEMKAMLHEIADYKIRFITKYYEVTKMDMLWYGDDWGTQTNSFLPPNVWREVIKPETQRIYDRIKSLRIILNQHSCGKIENIFGDIVEMGADMWNSCQPCNDLKKLKEMYGDKISFLGGIDSQFVLSKPNVTTEEIITEVKLRMDQMKGTGGYIAAPSHDVPYDPKALQAMNDAITKYGKYK